MFKLQNLYAVGLYFPSELFTHPKVSWITTLLIYVQDYWKIVCEEAFFNVIASCKATTCNLFFKIVKCTRKEQVVKGLN